MITSGGAYKWDYWTKDYPVIVRNFEAIGLFPVVKKAKPKEQRKQWYLDNGYAIENPHNTNELKFFKFDHWDDSGLQSHRFVFDRLKLVFPEIERMKGDKKGARISGLKFLTPEELESPLETPRSAPPQPSYAPEPVADGKINAHWQFSSTSDSDAVLWNKTTGKQKAIAGRFDAAAIAKVQTYVGDLESTFDDSQFESIVKQMKPEAEHVRKAVWVAIHKEVKTKIEKILESNPALKV